MIYELKDLEAFIDRVCSTGQVPRNDILTIPEEENAEKFANRSDEAVRKYILKCVKKR